MEQSHRLCYSVEELGRLLGLSRPKAFALVKQADFPAFRVGKRILVPAAELDRWLARQAGTVTDDVGHQ